MRLVIAAFLASATHVGCSAVATEPTLTHDAATRPGKPRTDASSLPPDSDEEEVRDGDRTEAGRADAGVMHTDSRSDAGQGEDAAAQQSADAARPSADFPAARP